MERFLITLSLGPVQSLIGAARRTRDLWCGSWLLSEAARAAARVLHEQQADCLIFPCPDDPDADLERQQRPGDTANIANILRAEIDLPNADAARLLCEKAKAAAASRVTALGASALERLGRPVRADVWQAQIHDILEAFAAWTLIAADSQGYAQASRRLGGVLHARKATRDFRACKPLSTPGLPKSSLDGARETVLPDDWSRNGRGRRTLGLSDGEQLDALGVIKRLAGDADQFTPYPRIAADPWIAQLTSAQRQRLRAAYEPLVALDLATRVRGNAGIYDALPFDAAMLYGSRLDSALVQARDHSEQTRALLALKACMAEIRRETTNTCRQASEPVPYAAILKADGDRMGRLLARAGNARQSREISRALHRFASSVRAIVRTHRGHAIYAGGDDVLALVPLAQAVDCAKSLADAFRSSLGGIAIELGTESVDRPTLSTGLGIGHVMEPLGAQRARAERAEHEAKGAATAKPRNALAILLGIRSGAELCWRSRWDDASALAPLGHFTKAYREDMLPARAAYDLRNIDLRLAWLRDDNGKSAHGMWAAEVTRMLERSRIEGGAKRIPEALRRVILEQAKQRSLRELADTLIIARWLAARSAGDVGEPR